MLELSYAQKLWLQSRGGRNHLDVYVYNNQPFVFMRRERSDVPILVPDTKDLKVVTRCYASKYSSWNTVETVYSDDVVLDFKKSNGRVERYNPKIIHKTD